MSVRLGCKNPIFKDIFKVNKRIRICKHNGCDIVISMYNLENYCRIHTQQRLDKKLQRGK